MRTRVPYDATILAVHGDLYTVCLASRLAPDVVREACEESDIALLSWYPLLEGSRTSCPVVVAGCTERNPPVERLGHVGASVVYHSCSPKSRNTCSSIRFHGVVTLALPRNRRNPFCRAAVAWYDNVCLCV